MPRDVPTPKGRPPLMPIYDDMKEAARVITPVETHQEATGIASGLPGDNHGRLVDPEPFKGRNLSRNPHPKISPQTMPETITQPFSGSPGQGGTGQKLTTDRSQPAFSIEKDNPRHQLRHSESLRKLTKR
jgi:hypothetical protein